MQTQERILAGPIDAPNGKMPQVGAACNALDEIVSESEKLTEVLERSLMTVLRAPQNGASGSVILGVAGSTNEPPVGLAQRLSEIVTRIGNVNSHIRSITSRLEL